MPKTAVASIIDEFRGDYSFLSNFYACNVLYQNKLYPSAEHAFQAAKTLDLDIRDKIAKANSPAQAKRFGRNMLLRHDWEEIKVHVMEEVVESKFGNRALRKKLLATGNALLIEGNYWGDYFWGACKEPAKGKSMLIFDGNKHIWYGQNKLGRILMDLREKLAC